MELLLNQIKYCMYRQAELVLYWDLAWSFQKFSCGLYKAVPGVVSPVFLNFCSRGRRKWSCDRYIARQHTIAHETRKTCCEPFTETDLHSALPSNHRSVYFKETTCPLYYIPDRDTAYKRDADSSVWLLPIILHILLYSVTFVRMGKFIWQMKTCLQIKGGRREISVVSIWPCCFFSQ